jgi:galactokinase
MNRKIKVESPGRINLIGEHVDYNGGSVLPGAIDKKVEFLIENIEGNKCIIESKTINKKFEFEFSNLKKSNEHLNLRKLWISLLMQNYLWIHHLRNFIIYKFF